MIYIITIEIKQRRFKLTRKFWNNDSEEGKVLNTISNLIKGTEWDGKIFLVGGAVRDEVLGIPVSDVDLLANEELGGVEFAKWLAQKTDSFREGTNPVVFPTFGTAKLEINGFSCKIEVVAPRVEKYTVGSRKPITTFASLSDDAERRDFTFNTLMRSLTNGNLIDPLQAAIRDIRLGVVRTPIAPEISIGDDPLRILRAVRFAARFDWLIDNELWNTIFDMKHLLSEVVSVERVREELFKMFSSDNKVKAVRILINSGLMDEIIPELKELDGLKQNAFHCCDALGHTLQVVSNLKSNDPIIVLAALLHDIGKPEAAKHSSVGHFFEHEEFGAEIAEKICDRLKLSNEDKNKVVFFVKNHMHIKQWGKKAEKVSDSAVRRFVMVCGDNLEDMLTIMDADNISHAKDFDMPEQISALRDRIPEAMCKKMISEMKSPVTGDDVMREFNIKPGKTVGRILNICSGIWIKDPTATSEDIIGKVKARMNI